MGKGFIIYAVIATIIIFLLSLSFWEISFGFWIVAFGCMLFTFVIFPGYIYIKTQPDDIDELIRNEKDDEIEDEKEVIKKTELDKEKEDSFKNYFLYTDFFSILINAIDNIPFHYQDIFKDSIKDKFDIIKKLLDEIIMQLPKDYSLENIKELTTYRNSSKIMEKTLKKYLKRNFNSEEYCIELKDSQKYAPNPNGNVLDDLEENGIYFYVRVFAQCNDLIKLTISNKIEIIQNLQKHINDFINKSNNPNKYNSSECIAISRGYELEQTYEILFIYYYYAMLFVYYSYLNRTIENTIKKSELYSLYLKLRNEVHNDNYIIEKLFPIYNSLYKNSFDIVFDDEVEFNYLIEVMKKSENVDEKEDYINMEKNILRVDINKYINIQEDNELLYSIFDKINNNMVSYKKYLSIEDVLDIDIYSKQYMNIFNDVKKQQSIIEKERILNGNFAEEKKIVNDSLDYSTIDNGYEFESFVANLYKMLGYNIIDVTSKSGDQGADVIIEKDSIKYAIQVKYYNNPVGNKAIQEVVAAKSYYKTDKAMVVTNSTYTKQAQELAKANDVILVDGAKLEQLKNEIKK